MNSADFEQHLKQLHPAKCDDRLAETFYQSGWQACEQAQSVRTPTQSSHRTAPTFATGLVCGLLVSAVAFLWAPKTQVPVGVNTAEQSASPLPEKARSIEFDQKIATAPVVSSNKDFEPPTVKIERWKIEDLFVVSPLAIERPSPLSRVARQGWSSQMQASADLARRSVAASATSRDWPQEAESISPLTASPFNSSMLDELTL